MMIKKKQQHKSSPAGAAAQLHLECSFKTKHFQIFFPQRTNNFFQAP